MVDCFKEKQEDSDISETIVSIPAAAKVLKVVEVLENILLFLPPGDLLKARSTWPLCFRNLIDTSPGIAKLLFCKIDNEGEQWEVRRSLPGTENLRRSTRKLDPSGSWTKLPYEGYAVATFTVPAAINPLFEQKPQAGMHLSIGQKTGQMYPTTHLRPRDSIVNVFQAALLGQKCPLLIKMHFTSVKVEHVTVVFCLPRDGKADRTRLSTRLPGWSHGYTVGYAIETALFMTPKGRLTSYGEMIGHWGNVWRRNVFNLVNVEFCLHGIVVPNPDFEEGAGRRICDDAWSRGSYARQLSSSVY
ncbi:hypothetical protein HII31_06714 [Pseudocercospora fuligena]|uniref:F-box domain-containing protein n=1 Tax=Pseudocercospora fuligena TaxID=685502 RepID=A0A8H6RIE6_9PEZI|nr:hypothetical protein HII31_06714 [Pseudocercospora fuligena]